jgi:formate dehydrogenase subunit delta
MQQESRSPPSRAPTDLKSSHIPRELRTPSAPGRLLMSPDRLIYMANQIGKFFQSQGHDKAVPGIADHIKKFWDPRMRKAIFAHLDTGGAGLDANVRDALETLKNA